VPKQTLGVLLSEARGAHALSLQDVATSTGCSPGYVHKLESDRVRTPSPRVLAGLASALGLGYGDLMTAAGYEASAGEETTPRLPAALKRFSNAHIVELLEQLQRDVEEIRSLVRPIHDAMPTMGRSRAMPPVEP
jgi:transcriptional regulator with XRE-family HTH domain